jgi:dolichol-phosphate mannosyltransferase
MGICIHRGGHEPIRDKTRAPRHSADLTDPMSGFFMIRRDAFPARGAQPSGEGYKILLDLFALVADSLRRRAPFTFQSVAERASSRLAVMWEYPLLIVDKRLATSAGAIRQRSPGGIEWSRCPPRYPVGRSQASRDRLRFADLASFVAMTSNYWLNNLLTYRDRRRRGLGFLTGLFVLCSLRHRVIANVGVANFVFSEHYAVACGNAGALVGTVGTARCVSDSRGDGDERAAAKRECRGRDAARKLSVRNDPV